MTTTMKHAGDEEYLEEAAGTALPGEEVLAAAVFGLQEAIYGLIGGQAAGHMVSDELDHFGVAGNLAGLAVDVAAMREGRKVVAGGRGMTVGLLVAVTPARVAVLNWDGEAAGEEKRSFDRATTEVHVKKFGLRKIITLAPTDGSPGLKLSGTTAHAFRQAGPDKLVLHLLTDPG